MNCDHQLNWDSDCMESEVRDEEMDPEQDRVIGFYTCPNCGYSYDIYSPSEISADDYPFNKHK